MKKKIIKIDNKKHARKSSGLLNKYERPDKGICSVEWCDRFVRTKGYCNKHYSQIQRKGYTYYSYKDPSLIEIRGKCAYIQLRNMQSEVVGETKIDIEDVDLVKNYSWYMMKTHKDYYVMSIKAGLLHRLILGVDDPDILVDHKNHDTLNNRKKNLRICNSSENMQNRLKETKRKTSSQYKGVTYDKERDKWAASISYAKSGKRKNKYLGRYDVEEDAALAYNKAAKKIFGKFALLNELED